MGRIEQALKALKESLINPPALGYPIRFSFSFLCMKRKGIPLEYSQKHGDRHRPLKYYSQQPDMWFGDTALSLEPLLLLTYLFIKTTEVSNCYGVPSNHLRISYRSSHHTWHLSVTLLPINPCQPLLT